MVANGKAFEYEMARSLRHLVSLNPGSEMWFRLYDGGGNIVERQPGDFIYAGALTWLIECKNTKRKSFPFEQIKPHQVESLLLWEREDAKRVALVAIRYETEKRMFLVPIHEIAAEINGSGRKSLHVDRAAELGIECRKSQGIWDLGLP